MPHNTMTIEIFSAPGCNKCSKMFQLAEAILKELDDESINLRRVNVVEELDYAVELGIRATPSIVINGALLFTAMPGTEALRRAILSQRTSINQEQP
jgi:protein-disulfide isomerase